MGIDRLVLYRMYVWTHLNSDVHILFIGHIITCIFTSQTTPKVNKVYGTKRIYYEASMDEVCYIR